MEPVSYVIGAGVAVAVFCRLQRHTRHFKTLSRFLWRHLQYSGHLRPGRKKDTYTSCPVQYYTSRIDQKEKNRTLERTENVTDFEHYTLKCNSTINQEMSCNRSRVQRCTLLAPGLLIALLSASKFSVLGFYIESNGFGV